MTYKRKIRCFGLSNFALHKRLFVPIVMIVFNLIISITAAGIFNYYVSGNKERIHEVALQGVMELSADMSRQLARAMLNQHEIIQDIADYVEATQRDEEETILYLEHMLNFDGSFLLVDAQSYQGYEFIEKRGFGDKKRRFRDFSNITAIKEACVDCLGEAEKEIRITPVFQLSQDNKKTIAFYHLLEIDEEEKVLFYVLEISNIIENVISVNRLITELGFLMDTDGNILYNGVQENNIVVENFYSYQNERYGEQQAEEIEKVISMTESGSFTQTDESGKIWIYTFSHLGDELDSGWIYINRIPDESLGTGEIVTWPFVAMITFMTVPWLFNVLIICWQNNHLKRRQNVIEEKNKELEAANKAQVAFISNMSHEIRTPINAVLGMDEMIIRETSEDEIREYAYNIKSAGKTLLGIINDILDFTKIEAGKMDIIPQEYELSSVINDLMNMIEERVRSKGLELQLNLNQNIPHILYGDELRIKQVILNILTNAVKYTEKGSISFTLDYVKQDEEHIGLKISVYDTGIGMKQEEMDKLSRPFERLDEKRNRTIEGTGLGMSIVTRLLMQMDSKLEVESVYGEGSTFSFWLTQKVVNWEPVGDLERRREENKNEINEDKALFHASKVNILVVDDTLVNLTVVKGLLKRTGVIVDMADSGKKCLEMCETKKYHVILLDHRMPEMDGIEVLHRLQERQGLNQHTPVIALTANAVAGAHEMYLKEGFCDFLSKPVNGNKMERMILKYLPEELLDTDEELMTRIEQSEGEKVCGSPEVYEQVCKEFAGTAKKNIRDIGDLYEQGDIENYTIKVHALKSSARLVGASGLSKEAEFLEKCGNEGNTSQILARTGRLLESYRNVAEQLEELYASQKEPPKRSMDEKELTEILTAMQEFCMAFDFDQVDMLLQKLEECQIPEEFANRMDELKDAVYNVNQEEIEKIIKEYTGGVGNE